MYRRDFAALFLLLLAPGRSWSGEGIATHASEPLTFHLGPATLTPSGFLESLTVARSRRTGDGANTRFGSVPLSDTEPELMNSLGHSRIALDFSLPGGPGKISGYIETDFLNRPPLEPYRFRLYFARYTVGSWEFSGGQEWSLLRPNRTGISSESALMSTRVPDPAYHVGVLGFRNRQVRVMRQMGAWSAAAAFEDGQNGSVKLARDNPRWHWEIAALAGKRRHYGASAAAVVHAGNNIDVVAQQGFARGEAEYNLKITPTGVAFSSTLLGLEGKAGRLFEFYAYGGAVWGRRSTGNRLVSELSGGVSRTVQRDRFGRTLIGVQFSHFDRTLWGGRAGQMNMCMLQVRRTAGGPW